MIEKWVVSISVVDQRHIAGQVLAAGGLVEVDAFGELAAVFGRGELGGDLDKGGIAEVSARSQLARRIASAMT